jgi:exonuclease VII large subunit
MSFACDALNALEKELCRSAAEAMQGSRNALETAVHRLEALAPQRTLERGFALIKAKGGAIDSITKLETGKPAQIFMRDGSADVTVDGIDAGEVI